MELIKALPEIFEDFAEQRKKSFLTMKELKDRDVPVVGAYCTYFPQEIAMAMGGSYSRSLFYFRRDNTSGREGFAKKSVPYGKGKLWFCSIG